MRAPTVVLALLLSIACTEDPANWPVQPPQQRTTGIVAPDPPADWQFDGPLQARAFPQCQPDPVSAEVLAFLKKDLRLEFAVKVKKSGKVEKAELARTEPAGNLHPGVIAYATKCAENALFHRPPRAPFETKVTIRFPARTGAKPE